MEEEWRNNGERMEKEWRNGNTSKVDKTRKRGGKVINKENGVKATAATYHSIIIKELGYETTSERGPGEVFGSFGGLERGVAAY